MDMTPRLRWDGHDRYIKETGCGHVAMDNVARAFWQSRCNLKDPPQLTDLRALAREIRNASCPLPQVRLASHTSDAPGSLPDAWSRPALPRRRMHFTHVSD